MSLFSKPSAVAINSPVAPAEFKIASPTTYQTHHQQLPDLKDTTEDENDEIWAELPEASSCRNKHWQYYIPPYGSGNILAGFPLIPDIPPKRLA